MKPETARHLAETHTAAMEARTALLEHMEDDQLVFSAETYIDALNARKEALAEAMAERAGDPPIELPPPIEEPELRPIEASPGVPLVAPPGIVVSAENLDRFGPLVTYQSKGNPEATVEATPYAFDAGTAIRTEITEVATEQPSRIIQNGDALAVLPEDIFNQTYEPVEPETVPVPSPESQDEPAEEPETPPEEEP